MVIFMQKLGNNWKISLICTAYNLLFEYSMRGVNDLLRSPYLPINLFLTYFTLFIMMGDLILRFKLRDYQLILLSFVYGTVYLAFASSFLFAPPTLLGINYLAWLFVNFVWWGVLQGVLTFYIGNRFVERDWEQPPLSRIGWVLVASINAFTLIMFVVGNPFAYDKTIEGLVSMCILILVFGLISYFNIKKTENDGLTFEKSKFLDIVMISTIVFFVFCAIFLISDPGVIGGSHTNQLASTVVIIGTSIAVVLVILYRLITKKPIPI